MTTPIRAIPVRRLAVLMLLGGATFAFGWPAKAQVAPDPAPGVSAPEASVPVELTINVLNGQVVCLPQTMRLPQRYLVSLRVINKSTKPILFAAPDFFHASQGMQTDNVSYNPERGSFLVEGGSTLPVMLRTPPAGEYYYACNDPGEVSTVRGTGFIVVVSGLDNLGVQIPPR